jgi:hypothetical protein
MSIRDAARIAALEARVSELAAKLERIERVQESSNETKAQRPVAAVPLRKGRR